MPQLAGSAVDVVQEVRALDGSARDALMGAVSSFEGSYWSLNLDGEFEGLFDHPKRNELGVPIPVAERAAQPNFRPNPFSKYGRNPGHVGLSFGFMQFTQDSGGLGKLLVAMRIADADAFQSLFGSDADELIRVTNLPGRDYVLTSERTPPPRRARRRPRVAPVAGKDLWESPWRERFEQAGRHVPFQRVQRDMANAQYLQPMLERVARPYAIRSQKGLCVLLDRSVQLGPAGCARLVRQVWGAQRARGEREDQSFARLYRHVRDRPWAHRMRAILAARELSFDVRFEL